MNSNISQLQPHPPSPVQRFSKDGQDKEASFLALRLLNKRARVRLSADPIKLDPVPGRGTLFAVANATGYFAAVTCNSTGGNALIVSSFPELRTAFTSTTPGDEIPFTPRRTVPLSGPATAITFASSESRLLVAFAQGSVAVYDTSSLFSQGSDVASPVNVFQSPTGAPPRELANNPGDLPDLVAILYEAGGTQGPIVHLLDVQKLEATGAWTSGGTPVTTPTSLCWSPKGKQLAIGLQSGDIITFSPNDTSNVKSYVPAPSSVQSQSVIGLSWLSNQDFHCIFAPPGPLSPESEQTHFIVSFDHKSNTETEVKLNTPYYPVPGLRPPGCFNTVLRHWDPSKFLLFSGDSTSSDIGLIGCTTEPAGGEIWSNLSLEENSTPSLPLDRDMNDTVLLGLALDLTGTEHYSHTTVSGEIVTLPPPPIMYAYVSDGTILGWNIINLSGQPYPGMVAASPIVDTTVSMDTSAIEEKPSVVGTAGPFQQSKDTPSVFGQTSSTGLSQGSAFGQSAFGQPSTFGQSSAFGSTGFGQTATLASATSTFENNAPISGGFGAFASGGSSKFGQASFGLGSLAPPSAGAVGASLPSPMAISMSNSEEPMSADVETDAGLGGLSLGSGTTASEAETPKSGLGASGLFGAFASNDTNKPAAALGSSGESSLVKPATGFGAFANQGPSAFGAFGSSSTTIPGESKPSAFSSTGAMNTQSHESGSNFIKPATGFGAFSKQEPSAFSAFGSSSTGTIQPQPSAFSNSGSTTSQPSPAFGQSGFGAKPSFGQSSFGQSSFGQSAFGQPGFGSALAKSAFSTGVSASGGGFASFANAGSSGFGSFAKTSGAEQKPTSSTEAAKPDATEADMSAPEAPAIESSKAPATPSLSTAAPAQAPATPETKAPSAFGAPGTPPPKSDRPGATSMTSPSLFKTTASAPMTGAFSSLTAHPTGFGKFDSGFGAFGSAAPSASSPFYNPPKIPTTVSAFSGPVSAFASTRPPTSTAMTAQPTFGTPSALGFSASSSSPTTAPTFGVPSAVGSSSTSAFGKSAFGATIKPATATSGSAFSAFASSGGFSAFSGGGKSFSELLKSDGGDAKGKTKETEKRSTSPSAKTTSSSVVDRVARGSKWTADETAESAWVEDGGDAEDQEGGGEEEGSEAFLSDSFSEEGEEEEGGEEEEEGEGNEEVINETEAEEASAPPTETKSTTALETEGAPLSEPLVTSSVELVSSHPSSISSQGKVKLSQRTAESSTTPPGSPLKEEPSVAAPIPVAPPTASSFGGIGLSRPSTRPIRSSPLTNTPISGDEDEGDLEEVTITPEKTPASQKSSTPVPITASPSPSIKEGVPAEPTGSGSKTPPLLSTFATPAPKLPPFTLAPPRTVITPESSGSSPPTRTKSGGIFSTPVTLGNFGNAATPPTPSLATTLASAGGLFGQKPATSTPFLGSLAPATSAPAATSGGFFGPDFAITSPTPATATQKIATSPGVVSPRSKLPPGGIFGPAAQHPVQRQAPTQSPKSPPAQDPFARMPEGMEKECARLVLTCARELQNMQQMAAAAQKRRVEFYKTSGESKTPADLEDLKTFEVGDAVEFGRLLLTFETDIAALKELRAAHLKSIGELESAMLRATMRKEEIVRFSKASTDTEFAKMLKARTLSPDHLETQLQLRRGIRVISDRIQKLEDHLQGSKKRLTQMKAVKPSIRPPSLDTLNRTYRNIDIAIAQQADDVSRLASRVTKLDLQAARSPTRPSSARRLPADATSSPHGRPVEITPNVAVTTAAALNAERAAQKLKVALLSARKEPLLNTQAIRAHSPPTAFNTPAPAKVKQEWTPPPSNFFQSRASASTSSERAWDLTSPPLPSKPTGELPETPKWTLPPFQLPESPASPTPAYTGGSPSPSLRQRGSTTKMHQKPVQLKKSAGSATVTSPPPNFSWGPLPGVSPMTTLSANVTRKDGKKNEKNESSISPEASLSDSWVADGFGKK